MDRTEAHEFAAGGQTVARQELTDTDTQIIGWQFTDASGLSSRGFSNEELDGLGNNVGILPNLNSSRFENAMTTGESPTFTNPDGPSCQESGVFMPCSMAQALYGRNEGTFFSANHPYPIEASGRWPSSKTNPALVAKLSHLTLPFIEYLEAQLPDIEEEDYYAGTDDSVINVRSGGTVLIPLNFVSNTNSSGTGEIGRRTVTGGNSPADKKKVRQQLEFYFQFKSVFCADALNALGLTDQQLLKGFDSNSFLAGGPAADRADASMPWTQRPGKQRVWGRTSIKTKNGVSDFLRHTGFLIHELAHVVLKRSDVDLYKDLLDAQNKDKISGLPIVKGAVNRDSASDALSEYFNKVCGFQDGVDSPLPTREMPPGSTNA